MELLKNCVGFKVLEYFLCHPSKEIYLRELSVALKISTSSVKKYCDALVMESVILEQKKGNLRLFQLNREDFAVKETMKAYHLLLLKRLKIDTIVGGNASLAIYGSFAAGNIDERSDLDILVIVGDETDVNKDFVLQLQEDLGREIQLTVISHLDWEKMKKSGERFAESVLRKHVLVVGAEL